MPNLEFMTCVDVINNSISIGHCLIDRKVNWGKVSTLSLEIRIQTVHIFSSMVTLRENIKTIYSLHELHNSMKIDDVHCHSDVFVFFSLSYKSNLIFDMSRKFCDLVTCCTLYLFIWKAYHNIMWLLQLLSLYHDFFRVDLLLCVLWFVLYQLLSSKNIFMKSNKLSLHFYIILPSHKFAR